MTKKIRLLIRRKQQKARRTGKKRDKDRYKRLQSDVQLQIRKLHKGYMQEVVSDSYIGNPKKFWSYIKSAGQEASGVSPLINENGFLKSDSQSRANILNGQFESVFTKRIPVPCLTRDQVHTQICRT